MSVGRYNAMVLIAKQYCVVLFLFFFCWCTQTQTHMRRNILRSFPILASVYFGLNRPDSNAFIWLKSIFSSKLSLFHSVDRFGFMQMDLIVSLTVTIWFVFVSKIIQFCLFICLFASVFHCVRIISTPSKSQQMSKFNIRLANALNNLRATILGTLLISTIAIMIGNAQPFSCLTNKSIERTFNNIGDGIDNDFRIIVFCWLFFFFFPILDNHLAH